MGLPVLLLRDFHVGLILTLLVLKGAVHQKDARVLNLQTRKVKKYH